MSLEIFGKYQQVPNVELLIEDSKLDIQACTLHTAQCIE